MESVLTEGVKYDTGIRMNIENAEKSCRDQRKYKESWNLVTKKEKNVE